MKINKSTKLCSCKHAKCWHVKAKHFGTLSKTEISHIKAKHFSPRTKKNNISQFLSDRSFARKPYYIFVLPPPIEANINEMNYCNNFEDLPA
tara:strand:+ start:505 stop:780 length:276 start_codon:yes stop_codon:yes gene_type:complete